MKLKPAVLAARAEWRHHFDLLVGVRVCRPASFVADEEDDYEGIGIVRVFAKSVKEAKVKAELHYGGHAPEVLEYSSAGFGCEPTETIC